MNRKTLLLASVLQLALLHSAPATLPPGFDYQAYVTDSSGTALQGPLNVTVQIYNVAEGGLPLWSDSILAMADSGLIHLSLGSEANPFPDDLFDQPLWLGIAIEGDPEMAPRRPLRAVPFAFRTRLAERVIAGGIDAAALAPDAVTSQSLAAGAVTADKIGIACAPGETLINTGNGWQCGSATGGSCSPGDFINCYSGPGGTLNVGQCQAGIRQCEGGVSFGACSGESVPSTEVCDALDNDCDGIIDNDPIDIATWYQDADGDGFGNTATSIQSCFAPPGYVSQGADCDDTTATTYPGAPELCDGVDNNCDALVDNECSNQVCTDIEGDNINACIESCGDDLACLSECINAANLSSQCSQATFELGICASNNNCNGPTDLNCVAEFCAPEYDAVFGPLVPECTPGATQACYGGPAETLGVGVCQAGITTCGSFGFYQGCEGEVTPSPEICADGLDQDCDAVIDNPEICTDADGDGWTVVDDCDDNNAAINPGAPEICNDGIDNNCDGLIDDEHEGCLDGDGDGFTPLEGDCNDSDAAINPDAPEICDDGIDNNCNELIDAEDTAVCDLDGDGWVAPQDCDDADASINPAADEVCDGVDNNCDSVIDSDAIDQATWYADADGDGFGNMFDAVVACAAPPGFVSDNQDCDDNDAAINPNAPEICDDGIDNDCNGFADLEDPACG